MRKRLPYLLLLPFAAAYIAMIVLLSTSLAGLRGTDSGPPSDVSKIALVGRQQTVFDWSREACEAVDVPDTAARAYRDYQGRVHLYSTSFVNRQLVGPSLDTVRHSCDVAMQSNLDPRPSAFDDREWITAPYTLDGRTIYALVHEEYHGESQPKQCPQINWNTCQYNSVTFASSKDGGASFSQLPSPQQLVASPPYRYHPDAGPYGLFSPSNIVRKGGYYYTLLQAEPFGQLEQGTCVIRTANLADPKSWRAWNGKSFSVRFADPYTRRLDAALHLCAPVSYRQIAVMSQSLTYNTYLKRYVVVGPSSTQLPGTRRTVYGIYFSVSKDLIHWSDRQLLHEAELPWSYKCGDRNPVLYPSLLDPSSPSRNFETTGRRPYLYFTRFHYQNCAMGPNRDLVRIRVQFNK